MKKLHSAIIFSVCLLFSNCTSDSNNPLSVGADIYVPQIENAWRDSKDNNHIISFFDADPNVNFGLFIGNENFQNNSSDLFGAFNNRDIEFVINRDGGVKFKGKFTSDTTITVQSESESYVLIRVN
jgi:hypothetical protein